MVLGVPKIFQLILESQAMNTSGTEFIILLNDGSHKMKLRIILDSISSSEEGKEIESRILSHPDVKREWNDFRIEVYNPTSRMFQLLCNQTDIAKTFGRRLHCTIQCLEPANVLAITGRFFEYDDGMFVGQRRLDVWEQPNMLGEGTGLNVWDGAILLVKYLEQNPFLVQGNSILELGAGSGLVGIACATLGAHRVIITDLQYTMMLMKENIKRNDVQNIVECRICDWLDPPNFDVSWKSNVLLIADCIWVGTLIQPLINTMKRFIESSAHERDITAIIAYQRRGKQVHKLFWEEVITLFDRVEKLEIPIIKPDTLDLYKCSVSVMSNSPPLSEFT